MQYDAASLEFRLLRQRFLREERLQLHREALAFHQATYSLLFLGHAAQVDHKVLTRVLEDLDGLRADQLAVMGRGRAPKSGRAPAKSVDKDRLAYMQALCKDGSGFASPAALQAAMNRLNRAIASAKG